MRSNRLQRVTKWIIIVALLAWFGGFGLEHEVTAQRRLQPGPALPSPQLFTVMPCGGRVGSTVEVTINGLDLEEPQTLLFSQPGIKAEPIIPPAPPAPPADAKKQAEPKKPAPKPATPPVITKFKVTIPADAPLGVHDVRVVNKWGVSNARAFVVGDLPEVLEKEPNDDVPQAQRIEMNSTITGSIANSTDVDYYVFSGKKGQRVVVSCLTSSIDSRLQAGLELFDSAGRQLAFNRHYQENDALVDCTLPSDGDYYVRVHQFTYIVINPTTEYFYRLSISTAPWIDAIVPLVVEPGKANQLTIYGRNLPGGRLDPTAVQDGCVLEKLTATVQVPSDPAARYRLTYNGRIPPLSSGLDGFEYRIRNQAGTSNPFLLTYARAPVVIDNGANDTPETAQEITLPCEISGCVEKIRDRDWYAFNAKKGDIYHIEVNSDRLGAQTDMFFLLRKPDTKQDLVEVDDNTEFLSQVRFFTRSDDPPTYRFVVPADGKYQLLVSSRDADSRAGVRQFYRVRITREQPGFRLIIMPPEDRRPDACTLLQGGQENYAVLVWRQDGFTGPITLTAEGLPAGVTCPPQVLGPNLKQTTLVLSAAPTAPVWTGEIKVTGTAVINGQTVVREARPANITFAVLQPQGIPAISRLERNLVLAVREKAPFSFTAAVDQPAIFQGNKANVTLKLNRISPDFKTPLTVTVVDPQTSLPAGLTFNNNQPLQIPAGKDTPAAAPVLNVGAGVMPGTYNVVLRGTAAIPYNKDPMAKQKPNANVILPSTPLTITVLPKQVASISVNNANPQVKIGTPTELVVKVNRMFDYAGEFKVQLVLPPNTKGIVADDVVIPAGKDEARVILKTPAGAMPGNLPNLIVRATATLNGNMPVAHEAKINVNVVK
jgi:hypothetical protein